MTKMFALVDCNNFFVSCERLFRPDLEGRPVVVLSSNDGCVVSRSNEAKALGIPMGAPAFQYRDLFARQKVTAFSANFELYGNISRRITSILTSVTPRTEVYSVDESFLDINGLDIKDYDSWGQALRRRILHLVGVPVSVGIAPTKTLAKLGASYAKKHPEQAGVLSLANLSPEELEPYLANFPLEDVWGIGRRLVPKLKAEGMNSALSLSNLRPRRTRQLMGLSGLQTVYELDGISCLALGPMDSPHKTIMRSRTFGEDTHELQVLKAAIANLAARAAHAARGESQLAAKALLSLNTSRHKPGYRSWNEEIVFTMPTSDSGYIISTLLHRLDSVYDSHQAYHRAGVTLCDLTPSNYLQIDLIGDIKSATHDISRARMQAIDAINARFGRNRIYYAAEDLSKVWQPRRGFRSPAYVTRWSELPEVFM